MPCARRPSSPQLPPKKPSSRRGKERKESPFVVNSKEATVPSISVGELSSSSELNEVAVIVITLQ